MQELLRELQTVLDSSSAGVSLNGLAALGVVIVAALFLSFALLKVSGSFQVSLRPLPAVERLKHAITDAAESGDTLHFSAGSGAIGGAGSADTLAGINAVAALAGRAATASASTLITTASPVALPLLQSASEQAYERAGAPGEYSAGQVRFAGDDRNAYAVSLADSLRHEGVTTSLLLGSLGDETLFIGERGRETGVTQVMGTPSTRALPYAITTADAVIIGEETYAASAYVSGQPAHLASLLVQDWLRIIVVAAIAAGVVWKSLGW